MRLALDFVLLLINHVFTLAAATKAGESHVRS